MEKRPNPFWHMMSWGITNGFILALSFMVILFDPFYTEFANRIELLFSPIFYCLALIYGVVPGVVIGFFVALALWVILRNVPQPFTKEDMNQKRQVVYGTTFSITFLLSSMSLPFFFPSFTPWLLFPLFFVATVETWIAHRYLYRLHFRTGGMESRKSKAKNDAEAVLRLPENSPELSQESDIVERINKSSENQS